MQLDYLYNKGAVGIEQALYLGEIAFGATGAATGVALRNKLPAGFVVTRFVCNVLTAFNAATTNALVLGNEDDDDAYMAADDITEGAAGTNSKPAWLAVGADDIEVEAKYTQSGTAATAGKAEFYAFVMKLPAA